MNAVDRGDQMRAYWSPTRRIRRGGWKALAWDFLLEISLINSFLLQKRGKPQWKRIDSQADWRQQLVYSLIETYSKETQSRERFRTGDEFTPITAQSRPQREVRMPRLSGLPCWRDSRPQKEGPFVCRQRQQPGAAVTMALSGV